LALELAAHELERPAGVEDVIDDEDAPALELALPRKELQFEIPRFRLRAVARDAEKGELEGNRDPPNEIRREDARALEHGNDRELASTIRLGHLRGDSIDRSTDLDFAEEHAFDVRFQ